MDRGLYTGALAMRARQVESDVIANNLANINTVSFKRDTVVYSDFPRMLARRMGDEYVHTPLHEFDLRPPVGTIGTGVQVDDIVTNHGDSYQYNQTGNPLDLALEGVPGVSRAYAFFEVMTPNGPMYTRAGNFTVNSDGLLVTHEGALVMGEGGEINLDLANFRVEPDGTILHNPVYNGNGVNMWEATAPLDKLRIVAFENVNGIEKVGYTLYRATEESGPPETVLFGVNVVSERLEASNVNPVREMTELIKAQRAYEAAAKVVQTHDNLLGQAITDVGRVG